MRHHVLTCTLMGVGVRLELLVCSCLMSLAREGTCGVVIVCLARVGVGVFLAGLGDLVNEAFSLLGFLVEAGVLGDLSAYKIGKF